MPSHHHLSGTVAALLLGATLALAESPQPIEVPPPTPTPTPLPLTIKAREEAQVEFTIAMRAIDAGDYEKAEKHFTNLLALPLPNDDKRVSLFKMARMFDDKANNPSKAAALYEQLLTLFPTDPEAPAVSLRLGRIYRDMGAHKTALNKFFNVLYTSLRVKEGEDYKDAVLQAKIEIANTHYASGSYTEAAQFYSRLKLLEMPELQREDIYFKYAEILFLAKDYANSLNAARQFLGKFPDSTMAPEAQYLVIRSLRAMDRKEDAMQETLKLLKAGKAISEQHPEIWARWQQKTGNEFANELYASGDLLRALTVYQTLAQLSEEPQWRWPAVYQIGLCFERLRHPKRALEAYQFIANAQLPDTQLPSSGVNLDTLQEMAKWRVEHLQWIASTEKDIAPVLGELPMTPPPDTTMAAMTAPLQGADDGDATPAPAASPATGAQKPPAP